MSETNSGEIVAARAKATRRRLQVFGAMSGVLYVLAFPGLDQAWLAPFAWVPVLVAVRGATVKDAFFAGWAMGFVSHLGGFYWVTHLLSQFAHAPLPLAVAGWLLLCVVQGASYGVGIALASVVRRRLGWSWWASVAVGLTAMDFAYPLLFPSYVGNTLHGLLWLMQPAELVGVLGLTTLVAAWNGALADVVGARLAGEALPKRIAAGLVVSYVLVAGYGAVRVAQVDATVAAAPKVRVGMVQANVGGMQNHAGGEDSHVRHVRMTRELKERGAELVVWPEGAFRGYVDVGQQVGLRVQGGTSVPLLFGALRPGRDPVTNRPVPYNSAFLADASGRVTSVYDKIVLLAFGEYIPGLEYFPWIMRLLPYSSVFGRGTSLAPLPLGGYGLATIICYEDIIPSHVRRVMTARDGVRPHALVNITNDSWYGDTTEPPIHLAEAVFRSIEHRRALVRSTNTGISAFVDPAGRTVKQTKTYEPATLLDDVPMLTGSTPYQSVGEAVGWLALAVVALAAFRQKPA